MDGDPWALWSAVRIDTDDTSHIQIRWLMVPVLFQIGERTSRELLSSGKLLVVYNQMTENNYKLCIKTAPISKATPSSYYKCY